MENTHPTLYDATHSLPLSEQADLARNLISANDLYKISNSTRYKQSEREEALAESSLLASQVLTQLPNDISALNLCARIEMDKNQLRTANDLLSKAFELDANNVNTRMNLGYLRLAQKQPEKAETLFKQTLELDETNHRAFSGVALAKLHQKDYVGAFTHYKKLIELGLETETIRRYFLDSAESLCVDFYQSDIEALLIHAFRWENEDLDKLGSMAASLLTYKYDLTNDEAAIDMEDILSDELFLQACTYTLMPSMPVESLITAVRQSILTEVAITRSLRDELLPAVIAVGHYAARTDYALMMSHDEELESVRLSNEIQQLTSMTWQPEDLAGALMVLSMYEALYTTPFSFKLLGLELDAWPLGMQSLMNAALYDLGMEHQYQYALYGDTASSILSNEVRRCPERWEVLPEFSRKTLYEALCAELDPAVIPKRFEQQNLSVLVLGCGSGKRACLLANSFKNIDVVAVDESSVNVAYTKMKADAHGLTNLKVLHAPYDMPLFHDSTFDVIEFGDVLNSVEAPKRIIEIWTELLAHDGIARLSLDTTQATEQVKVIQQLVQARKLSATSENIRHLRHAIAEENGSGLWSALVNDPRFYSGSGCKELFFKPFGHGFDLRAIQSLLKESGLDFIGFADIDKLLKERLNPMSPYNLMAWHVMDQDNCLFTRAYQLYVTRTKD